MPVVAVRNLSFPSDKGHDAVFKVYNENAGGGRNPMRAVQTKEYLYLWSPWSDGNLKFRTATTGTVTYRTLQKEAKTDPALAERLALFDHGLPEVLYRVDTDPDCLDNLIEDPKHAKALDQLRNRLELFMTDSGDHALPAFRTRADPLSGHAYTAQKQAESDARRANKRKGNKKKSNAPKK